MISLIIPTYRNPKYLDICLRSAVGGRVNENNEIIVVVDGFVEESKEVLDKYKNIRIGTQDYLKEVLVSNNNCVELGDI